jgi:hypothetical protein
VRGKGTKLGSNLGESCPKVRLSQDRLPIEPFSGFSRNFGIFSFGIITFGKSSWRQKSLAKDKNTLAYLHGVEC